MTTYYDVVRVPGRVIPEGASCDDLKCEWEYEGEKHAIREARAHTLETGHDTQVTSHTTAWYSRTGGPS